MNCPKCRTSSLVRALTATVRAGFECRTCGGIWLHLRELHRLAGSTASAPGQPAAESNELDGRGGLCPEGHGLLIRARIELEPPFYLDRCSQCHGVWFDRGEWQRLATHHLLEHLPELWTGAWQQRQRAAEQRRSYVEWANETFGDELFEQLTRLAAALDRYEHRAEALAFLRNESRPPVEDEQ